MSVYIMASCSHFLLFLLLLSHTHALVPEFRKATSEDVLVARKFLFKEAMNPLSLSTRTLLVAHDVNQGILGFGQIRPLDDKYSELASIYVLPQYRRQGVGSALVQELLERHDADDDAKICLLTLKPTISFYESHGFASLRSPEDLPPTVQFEFKAGSFISSILGNELVCMVR